MGIRVFFEGKKIIIREHHQFRVIFKDQIQTVFQKPQRTISFHERTGSFLGGYLTF
jgi:hypothetical protein